jgi:hypothetical protein
VGLLELGHGATGDIVEGLAGEPVDVGHRGVAVVHEPIEGSVDG